MQRRKVFTASPAEFRVSRLLENEHEQNTNDENDNSNNDDDKQPARFCNETVPLCFALPYGNALADADACSGAFSRHSGRIHCGLDTERPWRGGCPGAWRGRATPLQACIEWLRWTHSRRTIERAAEGSARRVH